MIVPPGPFWRYCRLISQRYTGAIDITLAHLKVRIHLSWLGVVSVMYFLSLILKYIMENKMKKIIYCLSLGMVGSLLCYSLPASATRITRSAPLPITSANMLVSLNQSTAKQLASLKGLGIKRAQAIVQYREQHGHFKSINDLVKVKGVGAKLLARVIKHNPGRMQLNPAA